MDHRKAIFVFGSNEGGLHGAGAAKFAYQHKGAQMGLAFGMAGQSFAIPTKDNTIRNTLSLPAIKRYVDSFLWQAADNGPYGLQLLENGCQITRIGCGLAGLKDEDIAPMFKDHSSNCWFDEAWKPYLPADTKFWGTF